jgi:NAD(P)H-nitrite reductase large subunit
MQLVAIGGSDAGISAALRARELDRTSEVTVVVADAYPNFSICGIPYYISGEVTYWRNLAHRTYADLEATGMQLRLDTTATAIDVPGQRIAVMDQRGVNEWINYDELVVGTGAVPVRPPITGPEQLGPVDGVHVLHSMGDTFALSRTLDTLQPRTALIVGAGYVGLEMAERLTARGLQVIQVEMLPEVLSTIDAELGTLVHAELTRQGVEVHTRSTVTAISRTPDGPARLHVEGTGPDDQPRGWDVDLAHVSLPPAPAYANTKPAPPATPPSPPNPRRTITRPTTPAPHPSPSGSPAIRPAASCSGRSWSAPAAAKLPNASTATPPPYTTT